MLVSLAKVQIIGRSTELERSLAALYRLQRVELTAAAGEPSSGLCGGERDRERDRLRALIATLTSLIALVDVGAGAAVEPSSASTASEADPAAVACELGVMRPRVEALVSEVERLNGERAVLRRYVTLLRRLLELAPELAALEERELAALHLTTVALLLSAEGAGVVDLLREALGDVLGERFWLLSAAIDEEAIGCVLVHPLEQTDAVHELLGQERIRHVPLPEPYARLSLRTSVESMEGRLALIPAEIAAAQWRLRDQLAAPLARWRVQRAQLAAKLEQLDAVALAGETVRTFHLCGWTPREELAGIARSLERELGGRIVVEELAEGRTDRCAPVLLRSGRAVGPFEPVVRFFDLPRSRSIDPTPLVALFLPLMFGLMVADVAYGAIFLAIVLVGRARLARSHPAFRRLSPVFIAGALWAVAFGIVFGEVLGDAGERLGIPALWLHRDSARAVVPLLLLGVIIGALHVVLGLVLGIVQAVRDRDRRELLGHLGTLIFLIGIFLTVAVAGGVVPPAATSPVVGAVIVGLGIVSAGGGVLGAITGPLELLGVITNVLSYLRLAAVGLASVYLAVVANRLAGVGPIWVGLAIATLLHGVNLLLAAFTPAVQALRLHYVEFFGKFFVGGGRAFRPFGARREEGAHEPAAAVGAWVDGTSGAIREGGTSWPMGSLPSVPALPSA